MTYERGCILHGRFIICLLLANLLLSAVSTGGCIIHDEIDFSPDDNEPPIVVESEITPDPGTPVIMKCPLDGGLAELKFILGCVIDESVDTSDGLIAARLYVDYDPGSGRGIQPDGICTSSRSSADSSCWRVECRVSLVELLGSEEHSVKVSVSDMDFAADEPAAGSGRDSIWWSVKVHSECFNAAD